MRTMSHYLIVMFTIMIFIFRLVVVFTTTMGIEFFVESINVKLEIIMLFFMLISIVLISKTKMTGALLYLLISFGYFGPDLFRKFTYICSRSHIDIDVAMQILVSFICVLIPVYAFFVILFAKKQERKPVDKKTDFFYKNDTYDRKYDERADKNNYRTL